MPSSSSVLDDGCCSSFFSCFSFQGGPNGVPEEPDRARSRHVEAQTYQAPTPSISFAAPTVALCAYEETPPDSEKNRLLPQNCQRESSDDVAAPARWEESGTTGVTSTTGPPLKELPTRHASLAALADSNKHSPAVSASGVSVEQGTRPEQLQQPQHRRTASHGISGKNRPPPWGLVDSFAPGVMGPSGQQLEARHRRTTSLSKTRRMTKGSSVGNASEMASPGGKAIVPQDEDDDFCPTCLEDYTTENPKIWTACAHHYHMPCIFEWLERKDTCPICETKMSFPGLG